MKKNFKDFSENAFNHSEHNRKILCRNRNHAKRTRFNSKSVVQQVLKKCDEINHVLASTYQSFEEFPLSSLTLKGLTENGFVKPTAIQRDSLGWSLVGKDIVGSAKTGSGKTLALVIPILEKLWKSRWTKDDGLGALVIVPTRELAYQIFEILNSVGRFHQFSAALLIGGTDVQFQMQRMAFMNIIICTPGRLLQHLEENHTFSCDQLQVLVIDETDRILDMGFRQQVDAILSYLPTERQTLLFSATQTKNTDDLARVSVKDPVYVDVDQQSHEVTPAKLEQNYAVCNDEGKVNMLWSFMVNNKKSKILVFVSCCKQARFLAESFRHLRPGLSVGGLWGTQNQTKRLEVYQSFNRKRNGAVLIATDVASRGLDFTDVDWVLQLDCPNSVEDYIHRVGRTARMDKKGRAVLILTPYQTKSFVPMLEEKGVPIKEIRPNPNKIVDLKSKLMTVIASFNELKEFAHGSIVAYAKAIFFSQNKSVFDVKTIDFDALSESYGLAKAPRIRFLKKHGINLNMSGQQPEGSKSTKKKLCLDNLLGETEQDYEVEGIELGGKGEILQEKEDSDDEVFTVKTRNVFNIANEEQGLKPAVVPKKNISKEQTAKKLLRKGVHLNVNIKFDEDGAPKDEHTLRPQGLNFEEARKEIQETNLEDKRRHKQLLKEMRKVKKLKRLGKLRKAEDELDLEAEEDGCDCDFSWLPDPDAPKDLLMNADSKAENNEDENDVDRDNCISETGLPSNRKRKLNSLQNAEEAALMLMEI